MNLLGMLLPGLFRVIEEIVPDEDKRNELKVGIQMAMLDQQSRLFEAQAQIITAEAKSKSWLTSSWRPITMLTFLGIIVWRTFAGPLTAAIFGLPVEVLVLPMDPEIERGMYTLMTVGLGGYVAGRSIEKASENIFSHRQNDTVISEVTGRRSED